MKKKTKKKKAKIECKRCTLCCRYICVETDAPENRSDFDDLSWLIAHERISIRVEGKSWYLMVESRCGYLDAKAHCRIYDHRPRICRRYKPGNCDFGNTRGSPEDGADHIFWDIPDLYTYRDKKFPKRAIVSKKKKSAAQSSKVKAKRKVRRKV